jgi:hypothetical protein
MMLADAASVHKAVRRPELLIAYFWELSPKVIVLMKIARRARSVTLIAATRVMMPNVDSSATAAPRSVGCNRDGPPLFAGAPC